MTGKTCVSQATLPKSSESSLPGRQPAPSVGQQFKMVLRTVWWPMLLLLLFVAILIGRLIYTKVLPGEEVMRPYMEWAALRVLPVATIYAAIRFAIQRECFFLWLVGLSAVLFCRELHFAGTSAGVYVGLVVLLWIAMHWYWSFASYWSSRTVMTILLSIFFLYFLAVTLDRNLWKFIPDRGEWASPLEEVLEFMGHVGVVILVILARPAEIPKAPVDE